MSSSGLRFCDQCGFEFTEEAKFCSSCGQPRTPATSEEPKRRRKAPTGRAVKWRSTDEYPYAAAGSSALLTGALMLGAALMGSGSGSEQPIPPLATTWLSRDEGVIARRPNDDLDVLTQIFGGFVNSVGRLDGPWDALEVRTPLNNSGLIMVAQAEGAEESQLRLIVPLAYGINPKTRDRGQIRASIDWLLSKMAAPYMAYVPLVSDSSERGGVLDMIIAQSGTVVPGPLSDLEWLSDPTISAVGSNAQGFPGAGSRRVGVLDEQRNRREMAVMRSGQLDLVSVPSGTVDVYAGWQLALSGMGSVGLMALGHRSLMGMIDAVAQIPAISKEFGGVAPSE